MEEEESKHINKTLNDLIVKIDGKIDELSKTIEKMKQQSIIKYVKEVI